MKALCIVHPDFSRIDRLPVTPQIVEYEEMLRRRIEDSAFPILIRSVWERIEGVNTGFLDIFDEDRIFVSGETFHDDRGVDGGTIRSKTDFMRLTALFEKEGIDSVEVCGSYLGQCAKGAAVQMYGVLNGIELRTPRQRPGESGVIENDIMKELGFQNGAVGLGIVLHHPSFDTELFYRERKRDFTGVPSIDTQLTRPETLVCEMGEIGFKP